ncbi:hypothetical protein BpHYR1_029215 [Brachionus plicatilis]|uniref:Uncharacterized protein n=1 Tax=Brachionus plicatilis TaxID=10195 RepID=A0A3M7S4F8_BRAPC|nr:hypothetical protein BpHYR1_029215 [Brachionus plicatilis]
MNSFIFISSNVRLLAVLFILLHVMSLMVLIVFLAIVLSVTVFLVRSSGLASGVMAPQMLSKRRLPFVTLVACIAHILGHVRVTSIHVPLVVAVVFELFFTCGTLKLHIGSAVGTLALRVGVALCQRAGQRFYAKRPV